MQTTKDETERSLIKLIDINLKESFQAIRLNALKLLQNLDEEAIKEHWLYEDIDSLLIPYTEMIKNKEDEQINIAIDQENLYKCHQDNINQSLISISLKHSPFYLLNTCLFSTLHEITLNNNHAVLTLTKKNEKSACLRILIIAKSGTDNVLKINSLFEDEGSNNIVVDIIVEENATLEIIDQQYDHKATKIETWVVNLHKKSKFISNQFYFNNQYIRRDIKLNFKEEHATCELNGAAILKEKQAFYNHLEVIHHLPNCISNQFYKTILYDQSEAEFSGLVHVKKGAHKTLGYQLSNNMVLSDQARILARPQLKIDADDVQCSHGAIIGQFDEEQVFYLQSKGLSINEAKQLILEGFIIENIEKISEKKEQEKVIERTKKQLDY